MPPSRRLARDFHPSPGLRRAPRCIAELRHPQCIGEAGAALAAGPHNRANQIENCAIQTSKTASSEPLVKALSIIEDLRTETLGRPDKPHQAV
jgi:hypothetical protein